MRIRAALLLILCIPLSAKAEMSGSSGSRGGPFFEVHLSTVSRFDSSVSGTPVVVGGEGFASVAKNFRLGGGGGGGFLWGSSDNALFGLGYGGIIGEYAPVSWFNLRFMLGGGGYSVSNVTTQTATTRVETKIGSGGFFLLYPSIGFEIPVGSVLKVATRVGYFFPNVSQLESLTVGLTLILGKN